MQLIPGNEARKTRSSTDPKDNATESCIGDKRRIDQMLARIQFLCDGHFDTDPDAVHWGDVGTINHVSGLMGQTTDIAFSVG